MPFVKKLSEIGEQLRNVLTAKGETVEHTESQLAQANESVAAARLAVERAELALEQSFGNQEADVHLAWDAVKNAKDTLHLAESRREAILKRLEQAEEDKRQTAHELRKEELHADVVKLQEAAQDVDVGISKIRSAMERWQKMANRIQSHGYGELDHSLKNALLSLKPRILDGICVEAHRSGLVPYIGDKPWLSDQITAEDVDRVTSKPKRVS